ncbi:MAG: GIY-YIG nuclease family protein [Clostridia bacterium]|nr:GIY-YIG nuclease family protein [Clostridia bacterium]
MYGYIYKTTNLINNKFYIGQHKNNKNNSSYLGSGKILKYAINKYGKENFKLEILEECDSQQKLNEREKYWIKILKNENCYNISDGGNGGNLGESVNFKISQTLKEHWKNGVVFHHANSGFKKGCIPWNKGKPGTMLDKHHTSETRKKLSEIKKGRTIPLTQREAHSLKMKGHPCSEETRKKMGLHCAMKRPECKEKARLTRLKNYKQKHWMTDGKNDRLILLKNIKEYENNGWIIGRSKGTKIGDKND